MGMTAQAPRVKAGSTGLYFGLVSAVLSSTSILVLQPFWSHALLLVAFAISVICLFSTRLQSAAYAKAVFLSFGVAVFVVLDLCYVSYLDFPISPENYIGLMIRLLNAIFLSVAFYRQTDQVLTALNTISIFIVVHAIVGTVLVVFFSPSPADFLDASDSNGFSYFHLFYLFFYSQKIELSGFLGNVYRTHGLAWEPGIFQFFANFLIFYALHLERHPHRRRRNIILGLTGVILSTSTMGAMIAAILFLMSKKIPIWVGLVATVVIGVPALAFSISKFDLEASQSGSTIIRLVDLEIPLRYFLDYPLGGIGNESAVIQKIGYHSVILDYVSDSGSGAMLGEYISNIFEGDKAFRTSNGVLAILMEYGGVAFLLYMVGLYRFAKACPGGMSFFIMILLTMFNEPVGLTVLFLWFMFQGAGFRATLPEARTRKFA